jgi:hypothetical protein
MMSTEEVLGSCAPAHEARRVADLWFHDGTLVLATETLLFRVYAGLLAKESPIFHDMLGLPQPKEGETMDGCPVVHLSDIGQDVEYFLKALFDYKCVSNVHFPSPGCSHNSDSSSPSRIRRLSTL